MGADDLLLQRRRLTVEEYHRAGEAGLFGPDERLELIDGDVITMPPIGWEHAQAVIESSNEMTLIWGRSVRIAAQGPLSLPPGSEPQPDIMVLRPEYRLRRRVPTAEDVLLLIEVADSSLATDRAVKIPLYARHGIPEVWLVSLPERIVWVHRGPEGDAYRSVVAVPHDGALSALQLPGVQFQARLFWPSSPADAAAS